MRIYQSPISYPELWLHTTNMSIYYLGSMLEVFTAPGIYAMELQR